MKKTDSSPKSDAELPVSLKLPKDVATHARHDEVLRALTTGTQPLWEKGMNPVPTFKLNPALMLELTRELAFGHLTQGIELIGKQLGREQAGLDALDQKLPGSQKERISRLLIMSNDGAERFYRECDTVLSKFGHRVLGIKLDMTGDELGTSLKGADRLIRALLVADKKAVAKILLALV